jgi:hypothetical protein
VAEAFTHLGLTAYFRVAPPAGHAAERLTAQRLPLAELQVTLSAAKLN